MSPKQIGLGALTTPIESPQSNGTAEAFVRTFKRDYIHIALPSCTNRHRSAA
jgi:hypothetical protein